MPISTIKLCTASATKNSGARPATMAAGARRRGSWPKTGNVKVNASRPPATSAEESTDFYSTHSQVLSWSRDTTLVASGEELRCTIFSGAHHNSEGFQTCEAVLCPTKAALRFSPGAHARKEDSQREHAPRSQTKHTRNNFHNKINVIRGRRDLNGAVYLSKAQRSMIA